jgi:hypothetical protein
MNKYIECRYIIVTFILILSATFCEGQRRDIDSIKVLIRNEWNDSIKVTHLSNLADLLYKKKKFKEAEKFYQEGLILAEEIGALRHSLDLNYKLYDFYKATTNSAKALNHYKEFIVLRDSIEHKSRIEAIRDSIDLAETSSSTNKEHSGNDNFIMGLTISVMIFFLIRSLTLTRKHKNKLKKLIKEQEPLRLANDTLNDQIRNYKEINSKHNQIIHKQKEMLEIFGPIKNVEEEISKKRTELNQLVIEYEKKIVQQNNMQEQLLKLEERLDNIDYGFYDKNYSFTTSTEYKIELEKVLDQMKEMIKNNEAVVCNVDWTIGNSKAEGRRMVKQLTKLMLRAFNGESDTAIAKVSWSNIVTMEARIDRAFESINKSGESFEIFISEKYKKLKKKELHLNYEVEEKIYMEKEEQRKLRERMKEEDKARREMERALKEAQDEEKRYENALEKARLEVESAKGREVEILNEKIRLYEERLKNAHENKERAISRAQLTKSGYVYIISNIGSFGENIYKIGMTRRLDPQDRVNELGDASVPFDFDVHGFIYSEDAPGLEYELHSHFENRRVNLVNYRTEFFKVTIDEIESRVKQLNLKVELTKLAMAREYRETLSLIQASNSKNNATRAN